MPPNLAIRYRMIARVGVALMIGLACVRPAAAQVVAGAGGATLAPPSGMPEHDAIMGLGQNYPNPFSPATRIPFSVGNPPLCTESGRQYRVSLKIYNLLAQLVAVPTLLPSDGGARTAAGGQPVQDLGLACGQYTAYWNGNYLTTSREVASGMYLYRLDVNGKSVVKKMFVLK